MKNKDEHSLISNRGGTSAQQMVPVLRPERTGLAVSVLPALRAFIVTVLSSDNSDAELASLQGTVWCGPACQVVWGPRSEMAAATRFMLWLQYE
ncbi:hypothetical protein Fuma_05360 [Fuerstiella marisgermanici]|uniref:Uncharacterized protein n=1 Tax=Fuerstiella marisgermanici TaxID=1891926 RepID=A0A1P8WNR9_9PLAN|nr:hypothetical protein Fuma_05360 [Fuerstiella marisgermanici]